MNTTDYIIIAVIVVALVFAMRKIILDIKNKKHGCCSGNCTCCKTDKKCDDKDNK